MSGVATRITANQTVNEILQQYPQTLPVFNEFGIDSCCGGGLPLDVATERDGVDLGLLLMRLNAAVDKS
jgi:regulator of cell morphogenesis and NO signaling